MNFPLVSVRIQFERDVVSARQRTREVAEVLGFDAQQQTRIATAVSEIARNALIYGGGGKAEFSVEGNTVPQLLSIVVRDGGPGISNVEEILEGKYRSQTGMGIGIVSAQRLMDRFKLDTSPTAGTSVFLGKLLPRRAPLVSVETLPRITSRIATFQPRDLLGEFREQNQELLRTLEELRIRQEELIGLNRELEDTNRGVVALYAELDEKADHLRRADEVKSRFLSNMSHEFRTPLNSILALSRLLLDRSDGNLEPEQEIQVNFIRKSAESLFELVNDLLDLAKVEAGKIVVHASEFEVGKLFGALRGMLRPLLVGTSVSLVFEEPAGVPDLFSDEGKVSQILRNFISNALKFTERGEVRISAVYESETSEVVFRVQDTGIGIDPAHQETIFLEFTQVDSPLQRKVKGTGLGLPLSRKLAEILGGSVKVESQVGQGSTFFFRMPTRYRPDEPILPEPELPSPSSRLPILLVEDHYETRLIYEKFLRSSPWQILSARSSREAENILRTAAPAAIVLDIMLQGEDSWDFLARLKANKATSKIPILVATTVDDRSKAMALGAEAFAIKPLTGKALLEFLENWTAGHLKTVLLVDDEQVSRYLLRQLFANLRVKFAEAENGLQGLQMAGSEKPDLIVMDLSMPQMTGFEALERMKADTRLAGIPVVIATSKILNEQEQAKLRGKAVAVISKTSLADPDFGGKFEEILRSADLQDFLSHPDHRGQDKLP